MKTYSVSVCVSAVLVEHPDKCISRTKKKEQIGLLHIGGVVRVTLLFRL